MTSNKNGKAGTAAELYVLNRRVEESRRELGETVQALAGKAAEAADIKGQLRRRAAHLANGTWSAARNAARRSVAAGRRTWSGTAAGRRRPATQAAAILGPTAVLAAVVVLWQVRRNVHR